ncbi:unnamed protein product, partial [Polarella glacialis]
VGDAEALLQVGLCAQGPDSQLLTKLGAVPRSFGVQLGGADGSSAVKTGDVIGVSYDQAVFPVAVEVWHNGVRMAVPPARG